MTGTSKTPAKAAAQSRRSFLKTAGVGSAALAASAYCGCFVAVLRTGCAVTWHGTWRGAGRVIRFALKIAASKERCSGWCPHLSGLDVPTTLT